MPMSSSIVVFYIYICILPGICHCNLRFFFFIKYKNKGGLHLPPSPSPIPHPLPCAGARENHACAALKFNCPAFVAFFAIILMIPPYSRSIRPPMYLKARFGVNGELYRHQATAAAVPAASGGGSKGAGGRAGSTLALHPRLDDAMLPRFAQDNLPYELNIRIATQMWIDLTPMTRLYVSTRHE